MIEAVNACPSCGGSGGGPFGRVGSAWDDESYECPRCRGTGVAAAPRVGPGARPLAKTTADVAAREVAATRGELVTPAERVRRATGRAG